MFRPDPQDYRGEHDSDDFEARRLAKVDRAYYRAIGYSHCYEDEGYERIIQQQLADMPQRDDL